MSVNEAVARLNAAFPLAERLVALSSEVRAVQSVILRSYLETGEPPAIAELDPSALSQLTEVDAVVVRDGQIVGAYPFSSEETGHTVEVDRVVSRTMCSLDALAVAPIYGVPAVVRSACAVTGDLLEVSVSNSNTDPDSTVHIGIHFQDPSSCAASSLCREMIFLRDADAAAEWRAVDPDARGTYGLAEGIEFAHRFFSPIVP